MLLKCSEEKTGSRAGDVEVVVGREFIIRSTHEEVRKTDSRVLDMF